MTREAQKSRYLLAFISLPLAMFIFLPVLSLSLRTKFMTVIQAGDYDLVQPQLLWLFGIGAFVVTFLSSFSPKLSKLLVFKIELLLNRWSVFCSAILCIIFFRLRETFSCFTWGYDSYHWVASNYIRPGFLRFFYGLFVDEMKIKSESEVLQEYIGRGPICRGFDMLHGVQAQQVFYFFSLFILVVALRMTLIAPLTAVLICMLICSGSITGQLITFRNGVMCLLSGILFGFFFINQVLKKPKTRHWFLFLVGLFFIPSFVLFDSTPFPGQEVMSETLYLGLLNLVAASSLFLFKRQNSQVHVRNLAYFAILGILMVVLSQTRLQGLVLFILFIVSLLWNIFNRNSRLRTSLIILALLMSVCFVALQNSSSRPQEPMTFWGTASIALKFLDESPDFSAYKDRDAAVIKNAFERVAEIKKNNADAGLPNDSQNLNYLYQGLIPAFDEVMRQQNVSRNEVFRSITITSIMSKPTDWAKFCLTNLAHVFGFGLPIIFMHGVIPTVAMPYSTVFFSPVISLLFFFICVYVSLSVVKRRHNWIVMFFPFVFLLEALACSTFGEPLARYIRLTESFILIFVLFFLDSLSYQRTNYIRYLNKSPTD